MKARDYAEAIYLATKHADDSVESAVVERLMEELRARGHEMLLPAIIRELELRVLRRASSAGARITVAHAGDVERHASRIEADLATLSARDLPREVRIDTTVSGGYEVRALGVRIDRTHKRSLVDMYRTLTRQS
jgi:F0F1-type ATP synthase delta subunit